VFWIDHLIPFQRSNKGPLASLPTATQAVAIAHDTSLKPALVGLGVGWIDHRDPFQRPTDVGLKATTPKPVLPASPPTATHTFLDAHDTAAAPRPFGIDWIDHLEPFQRSTSVLS
jgi:hypothetical protein